MNNFYIFVEQEAQNYLQSYLKNDLSLHIRIKKSGCSGYGYDLFYEKINKESEKFDNIYFNIEQKDKSFLNNSFIKLEKLGINKKITIDNPNIENACGCGESFQFKKDIV